jgi:hypothetical protein
MARWKRPRVEIPTETDFEPDIVLEVEESGSGFSDTSGSDWDGEASSSELSEPMVYADPRARQVVDMTSQAFCQFRNENGENYAGGVDALFELFQDPETKFGVQQIALVGAWHARCAVCSMVRRITCVVFVACEPFPCGSTCAARVCAVAGMRPAYVQATQNGEVSDNAYDMWERAVKAWYNAARSS